MRGARTCLPHPTHRPGSSSSAVLFWAAMHGCVASRPQWALRAEAWAWAYGRGGETGSCLGLAGCERG